MGHIPKKIANFAVNYKLNLMQFSVNQIASLCGGTVEGNGDIIINSFAKIEEGRPGAISFLANPKYTHHIYDTASSAVLVSRDFAPEKPLACALIRVDDPYATVASLMRMASAMLEPAPVGIEQPCHIAEGVEVPADAYVGAFAYIGKGAELAPGVKIFPGAYVGDGVKIGAGSVIKPNASVYHGCVIGERCIVHSGAVIGADGFGFAPTENGYEKIPQLGNVVLEDDVEIGANTTVDRAMMGSTRVGRGTKLDNLIQVAHNCVIGEQTVMAAQVGIAGSTHVGSRCMFGGQVGIAGHITIGDNVQLGAQSGVPNSIPSDRRMMGSPAIPAGNFARMAVAQKNLPDLMARLRRLELEVARLAAAE